MPAHARRRSLLRAIAATVLCASAACSLTVSLDGLTGNAPDPSLDASVSEAAASDAPVQPDAALDVEAGTVIDAGGDADADAGKFCSRAPHDFCHDFDNGQTFAFGWTEIVVYPTDSGVAELETVGCASPPACGGARSFARPESRGVIFRKIVAKQATTRTRFSFDVRVDTDTTSGGTLLFKIVFATLALPNYELAVVVRGTSLNTEEHKDVDGGAFAPNTIAANMKLATWTHFDGEITFSGPPRIVIHVEGLKALEATPQAFAHPGTVNLQMGTPYTASAIDTKVRFDNVTIDND